MLRSVRDRREMERWRERERGGERIYWEWQLWRQERGLGRRRTRTKRIKRVKMSVGMTPKRMLGRRGTRKSLMESEKTVSLEGNRIGTPKDLK